MSRRILIVEDNPGTTDLLKNCLELLGCMVDTGSTPISRTVELRVAPSVAAVPVSVAAGDYASVRYSQRYPLWLRLSSGSVVDSRVRV